MNNQFFKLVSGNSPAATMQKFLFGADGAFSDVLTPSFAQGARTGLVTTTAVWSGGTNSIEIQGSMHGPRTRKVARATVSTANPTNDHAFTINDGMGNAVVFTFKDAIASGTSTTVDATNVSVGTDSVNNVDTVATNVVLAINHARDDSTIKFQANAWYADDKIWIELMNEDAQLTSTPAFTDTNTNFVEETFDNASAWKTLHTITNLADDGVDVAVVTLMPHMRVKLTDAEDGSSDCNLVITCELGE